MNSYYNDTLYPLQDKVLKAIDGMNSPFYLTGGTALSRGYFEHRYSDDLDLFVNQDSKFGVEAEKLVSALTLMFDVQIKFRSQSFFSINVNTILKVEMVNDVAFRRGEVVKMPIFSRVDNIHNILSNKLSAVVSRDEPKDVVDIWTIANNTEINWPDIFQDVCSKAAGIFPPEVAQRLIEFPPQFLAKIKWVEGKQPSEEMFVGDISRISDEMVKI